ncbi:hypothetical protein BDQ17DRAFT_1364662 [Cyathus striatus]|nr:hypothetical protein BDQ17DRAFT_1364662 [Cyathus striatus]
MDGANNVSPDILRDVFGQNYLHILAISMLYYDHLVTTGDEINYLWRRPKGASTFWFFLNRYFAFCGNFTSKLDPVPNIYANALLKLVLLTLRIYALYSRSFRILACMVASGAVLLIVSCWSVFGQKNVPFQQQVGCIAAAWEALMVYDTMIFCLTLYKTWTTRLDHGITGIRIPLISLILRDGITMVLANLANILTFIMSVTMMSRIMLNLHQSADIGIYSSHTSSTMQYSDSTSDMIDRSPQNSPVRSTFPARRGAVSPGVRRESRIRWQDSDSGAQNLDRSRYGSP